MKPLSITWVTLVGFVCALLSFLCFFTHMRAGGTPLIVTPGPAVVFAVATALLIWSGLSADWARTKRRWSMRSAPCVSPCSLGPAQSSEVSSPASSSAS